jgi:hypothetical protein
MSANKLAAMLILLIVSPSLGAAPPSPNESNEPYIAYLFPAGGQRGTTVRVTVGGAHLQNVTEVRVSGAGISAKATEPTAPAPANAKAPPPPSAGVKPKQPKTAPAAPPPGARSLTLTVAVAPDAELGEREVRVMTPNGASNAFRFVVGQLPEVVEKEPNNDRDAAHRLEMLPVLVNGQVFESDRDYFRFAAKKGQTIVCAVQARVLLPYIADAVPGWNDVVLTLFDAAGRKLQCVDDSQLRPDPVLIFQPPADGEYLLEVRDVLYRGRADFVYRLSVGATPCVTHVFPLGARQGSTVPVTVYGANLPRPTIDVATAGDPGTTRAVYVETGAGLRSNALPFALGRERELTEREPNDTPAKANRVEWPSTVNGRIERAGDADCFTISGQAGQKVAVEVLARRLGSPIDAIVTLSNSRGVKVAENDDNVDPTDGLLTHHADPRVLYTFPTTGDYVVRVRDVQGKGGLEYGYRLTIAPPRPDFALRVSPDNPRVAPGDSVAITVTAVRRDGYAGSIDLSVKDLPNGFVASETSIAAGRDAVTLTVTAPAGAQVGALVPTVVGTAKIGELLVVRQAAAAQTLLQAFTLTQIVPTRELVLAVVDAPAPFGLALVSPADGVVDLRQGETAEVTVRVTRREGMKGAVALRALNSLLGVSIRQAQVPPERDEGILVVTATRQAPVNARLSLVVVGTHRGGNEPTTRTLPAITLRVRPGQ